MNFFGGYFISFDNVVFNILFLMAFSLQNIDDAGFGLRDGSKLESLINRKSGSSRDQDELADVWGSCGHVFVATNAGRNLHAFESIHRSKWTPESESLLLQG